jgi:hypothetical protein
MSRPYRLPARSDLEIPVMVARGLSIDQAAAYAGCRTVSAFGIGSGAGSCRDLCRTHDMIAKQSHGGPR